MCIDNSNQIVYNKANFICIGGRKFMDIMAIRLRTLREKIGMSQAKLAKEIGVTQASVNRYETARTTPPVKVLLFYADRFDVSLD